MVTWFVNRYLDRGRQALARLQARALERACEIGGYRGSVDHGIEMGYEQQNTNPIGLLGYALTSGTTDVPKYIPITQDYLKALKQTWLIWGLRIYAKDPSLLSRKIWNFSTHRTSQHNGRTLADMSYWISQTQGSLVRQAYVFSSQSLTSDDLDKNYMEAARKLFMEGLHVGLLVSTTPVSFLRIAQIIQENGHRWFKERVDNKSIDSMMRARLEARWSNQNEPILPADILHQGGALATWLGGSFQHYLPGLQESYGRSWYWDLGYCASEGHFAIPLEAGSTVLLPLYWIYHFRFRNSSGYFDLDQIQEGEEYEIFISGPHGFVLYPMNDIVRCEGKWNGIPLLAFVSKTAHFIDISGEKISSWQFARALSMAGIQHHVKLTTHDNPRGYCLISSTELDTQKLDKCLQTLNFTYGEHRRTQRLAPMSHRLGLVQDPCGHREKPDFFDSHQRSFDL